MRLILSIAVLAAGCGSFGDPVEADSDGSVGSCTDGVRGGDESDVDCGGPCGPCTVGEGCFDGADCETSTCAAGVCLVPSTCKQIADSEPGTPSGIYTLDDGSGSFDAFCDMDTTAAAGLSLPRRRPRRTR